MSSSPSFRAGAPGRCEVVRRVVGKYERILDARHPRGRYEEQLRNAAQIFQHRVAPRFAAAKFLVPPYRWFADTWLGFLTK